jgi:pre-mRNA-splicing factor CWC26
MEALKKLYATPPDKLTDYELPTKRRKTKSKTPIAPVKSLGQGFKIVDVDKQHAVVPIHRDEESDDEDRPIFVEDRDLMEQFHYEQKLKKAKEQRSGWVDVSEQTAHNPARDLSPPRKPRFESDPLPKKDTADISPPRKPRSDKSSVSIKREDSTTEDLSPPRKYSKTESTRKESNNKTTADLSPPRNKKRPDISPPRSSHRNEKSPTRNNQSESNKTTADLSPPRNKKRPDISPPRPSHRNEKSPTRNNQSESNKTTADLSPPRDRTKIKIENPSTREKSPPKTAQKTGLISGQDIQKHHEDQVRQRRENRDKLDAVAAGKGAETIYRDKKGRPLTMLNKLLNPESQTQEEQYEWGGGKKDKEAEEEKKRIEEEEKGKPYRGATLDDEKLNQEYRDAVRFGDPMAHLLAKRIDKKRKKASSSKKVYQGFCPPNRFGIKPGYQWDGVDRSNQYEANLYKLINERGAQEEIALRFAQEDM